MRVVETIALSVVAATLLGCPGKKQKTDGAPTASATAKPKDGPVLAGDATLFTVGGKFLVALQDGKYTRIKKHVPDKLSMAERGFYFRTAPPNKIQRYFDGAFEDLTYPPVTSGIPYHGLGPQGSLWISVHSKDASSAKIAVWTDGKWKTHELPKLDPPVKQIKSLGWSAKGDRIYLLGSDFQGKMGPVRRGIHVGPRDPSKGKWLSVELETKKAPPVQKLVVRPDGSAVLTVDEGLLRVREAGGSLQADFVKKGPHVRAIPLDGPRVLVSSMKQLEVLEGDKLSAVQGFGAGYREKFAVGSDGTMAAGYRDPRHVKVRAPDGKMTRYPEKGALAFPVGTGTRKEAFRVDGAGRVWVGTQHGLLLLADGKATYLGTGAAEEIGDQVTAIHFMGKGAAPAGFGAPKGIKVTGKVVEKGTPLGKASVQTCLFDITGFGSPGRPTEIHGGGFCGRGNPDTGSLRFETKTDDSGVFSFEIPPGAWRFGYESKTGWLKLNKRFCKKTKPGETCDVGNLGDR